MASAPSTHSGLPNRNPLNKQQLPLASSEIETSRSLPRLSAKSPPHTEPNPPMAIVVNARREINLGAPNLPPALAAMLAARNAGI
jgi:hypothetical protein